MLWVRGEVVPDVALAVGALDRAFEHGIGLFETFRTWDGHSTVLDRHLERLRNSATELGIPLEAGQLPDARAVAALISASGEIVRSGKDTRLRITLSGGLATSPPAGSVCWMTAGPLPRSIRPAGAVITRSIEVAADDPLARHKTLNYWRKRIAFDRAIEAGDDEVVCLTHDRLICEASRSNIFLVQGGRVATPRVDGPLLPGIMRQVVVERARKLGVDAVEELLEIGRIEAADEVFLTNSVRGIVPVGRIMGVALAAPGPVTVRLWNEASRWLGSGGAE